MLYSGEKTRDSELSEEGLLVCEEKQERFNQLKVHTVFVSPLKRAVQTAYNLFKNHPDFESIKFIILPSLREIMNHSSGIPGNIETTIEELKKFIPQLDHSELEKCHGNSILSLSYF